MNDTARNLPQNGSTATVGNPYQQKSKPLAVCNVNAEILDVAQKLLSLFQKKFKADNTSVKSAMNFLQFFISKNTFQPAENQPHVLDDALDYLQKRLALSHLEIRLLIIAGMAQEHEGFADIFRSLHPDAQPLPTPALLAQALGLTSSQRQELSNHLMQSSLIKLGIIKIKGDNAVLASGLSIDAQDWYAIMHRRMSMTSAESIAFECCQIGLQEWITSREVTQARKCLSARIASLLVLQSHSIEVALNRAFAITEIENRQCIAIQYPTQNTLEILGQLARQCLINDAVPLLVIAPEVSQSTIQLGALKQINESILVCASGSLTVNNQPDICFTLTLSKLSSQALTNMWQQVYPEMAEQANLLAARFPFEPSQAMSKVRVHRTLIDKNSEIKDFELAASFFKRQSTGILPNGVKRVIPKVTWKELVLPAVQQSVLKEAISRLQVQHKVLDEWQFLQNRRGARGVRLLFSGLPGTGKTLSAEVLASALNVDLLIIDLAALVSKWIGETEKNLAEIFAYAEQTQAILFFDEADAIFGKRTEVSDSHDRYANLETAYLLSRVEAYDGMVILATNFRHNIDAAFIRRLEYIIEFREPNVKDRERLWRCHVPDSAPLDKTVNFSQLANLYPMVGGEIRNAAVSAAFCAAQQQQIIKQEHFISAIRQEYEKTGKAFREVKPS